MSSRKITFPLILTMLLATTIAQDVKDPNQVGVNGATNQGFISNTVDQASNFVSGIVGGGEEDQSGYGEEHLKVEPSQIRQGKSFSLMLNTEEARETVLTKEERENLGEVEGNIQLTGRAGAEIELDRLDNSNSDIILIANSENLAPGRYKIDSAEINGQRRQFGTLGDPHFTIARGSSMDRMDWIYLSQVSRDLTDQEYAALSGVRPGYIDLTYSSGRVKDITKKIRGRAKRLDWNYKSFDAVQTWQEYSGEDTPEEIRPEGVQDLNVGGNTYKVSPNAGMVMRTNGKDDPEPQCYEGTGYVPPNYPPEDVFPTVNPEMSELNEESYSCPSFVSQENLDWMPSDEELRDLDTYCPASQENGNYYQKNDGLSSYIDTNCVKNRIQPICESGADSTGICQDLKDDICQYDQGIEDYCSGEKNQETKENNEESNEERNTNNLPQYLQSCYESSNIKERFSSNSVLRNSACYRSIVTTCQTDISLDEVIEAERDNLGINLEFEGQNLGWNKEKCRANYRALCESGGKRLGSDEALMCIGG